MTERLGSGMTARQAVDVARQWWERTGRDHMRRRLVNPGKVDASREDEELLFRSGIVRGEEWGSLTTEEQATIVKKHQASLVSELADHNDDKGKINGNAETRSGD